MGYFIDCVRCKKQFEVTRNDYRILANAKKLDLMTCKSCYELHIEEALLEGGEDYNLDGSKVYPRTMPTN